FEVHVFDPGVRVVAAGGDFVPRHRAGPVRIGQTPGGTGRGDGHVAVTTDLPVDLHFIDAVGVAHDLDHPVAVGRFGVLFPHAARFEDMPISINDRRHKIPPCWCHPVVL